MLTINHINPDQKLVVVLALTFAVEALPIFETKHPDDLRPRQALITTMRWLQGEATKEEYREAAQAAYNAACSVGNINIEKVIQPAAYAAFSAYAAAYAIDYSVVNIVNAISYAAVNAAHALGMTARELLYNRFLQLLPSFLEYKIENQQRFNHPEEILEYLSELDKDKFLFNLDILC